MVGPIQLHHLPKTLAPFPPGSMLAPRPSRRPPLLAYQPAAQRLVIQNQPLLTQMFSGQSRSEISVAFAVTGQDFGAELPALAARAGLAAPHVNQARISFPLIARPDPLGLAITQSHDSGPLGQSHLSFIHLLHHNQSLPFLAAH